jgi:hypothetical protein
VGIGQHELTGRTIHTGRENPPVAPGFTHCMLVQNYGRPASVASRERALKYRGACHSFIFGSTKSLPAPQTQWARNDSSVAMDRNHPLLPCS